MNASAELDRVVVVNVAKVEGGRRSFEKSIRFA
jgi:hypothetical protein